MKSLLLFCVTSAFLLLSANGKKHSKRQAPFGDEAGSGPEVCRTQNDVIGTCVSLEKCWSLYSKLDAGDLSTDFRDFLTRSICRYNGKEALVCCPGTSNGTSFSERPPSTRPQAARSRSTMKAARRRIKIKLPSIILRPPTRKPRPPTRKPRPPTRKPRPHSNRPNKVASQSCGKKSIDSDKIVNGVPSKKGAWPWIATLGFASLGGGLDFLCGGVLITNKHVLTAAHCVIDRENLSVVRLGSHNLKNDTVGSYEEIKITGKTPHEKYSKDSFENDIAILTLEKPVKFKDTISPICLPTGSFFRNNSLTPANGAIAGWGDIDYQGPHSSALMEARVPIRTNEDCKKSYSVFNKIVIDSRTICAGNGNTDTCQGDSGGPLMVYDQTAKTYNVAGVESVGYKCAEKGFPGIYTRVTSFLDWIKEQTK